MKKLLLLISMLVSLTAISQVKKDTTVSKKDTAFVPLFQQIDTIKNLIVVYITPDGIVKGDKKSYAIVKNWVTQEKKVVSKISEQLFLSNGREVKEEDFITVKENKNGVIKKG